MVNQSSSPVYDMRSEAAALPGQAGMTQARGYGSSIGSGPGRITASSGEAIAETAVESMALAGASA